MADGGHPEPRHVWVRPVGITYEPRPGILLDWRRSPHGWEALVIYAEGGGRHSAHSRLEWLSPSSASGSRLSASATSSDGHHDRSRLTPTARPNPASTSRRGPRLIPIDFPRSGRARIYASARIADALEELRDQLTFYHGVRLLQVLEAVYEQGKKDGRGQIFKEVRRMESKPELKFRNPGRPRRREEQP